MELPSLWGLRHRAKFLFCTSQSALLPESVPLQRLAAIGPEAARNPNLDTSQGHRAQTRFVRSPSTPELRQIPQICRLISLVNVYQSEFFPRLRGHWNAHLETRTRCGLHSERGPGATKVESILLRQSCHPYIRSSKRPGILQSWRCRQSTKTPGGKDPSSRL